MESSMAKPIIWVLPIVLAVVFMYSPPGHARVNIGQVVFTTGSIQAVNNGIARPLKRGSAIQEGDVIYSGVNTKSQIRMVDGALIALRPNTAFGFEKYRYRENDDGNNSSLLSLIRGGFRTISGLIGLHSKENYRVTTRVATIGIRGTHYGLTICQQGDCNGVDNQQVEDGLYGSVIDGEINAKNDTGEFVFSNDEFFHVKSLTSKPRSLIKPPGVIFAQNEAVQKLKTGAAIKDAIQSQIERRQLQQASMIRALATAEQRNLFLQENIQPLFEAAQDSGLSPVSYVLPAQEGNVLAYSYTPVDTSQTWFPVPGADTISSDGTANNQFFINAAAKENGLLVPIAAKQTTPGGTIKNFFIGEAKVLEPKSVIIPGTNVAVGWGRWSTQFASTDGGAIEPHLGQLHYIVASSTTTANELAQLGGLRGNASYTTIGGTRATDLNGNIAADIADVTMSVDFINSSISSYSVVTNVGGKVYEGYLSSLPVKISGSTKLDVLGADVCPACLGTASVSFFGPNAEGAGTTYAIQDTSTTNTVNGAAILISQ